MKSIGVVASSEMEVKCVKDKLESLKEIDCSGRKFYEGNIGDNKVIVGISGVGKVNSALVTEMMLQKYDMDCLFITGVAGSINPLIKVSDIVISDSITYHDVNRLQMKTFWPYCEHFESDGSLINKCLETVSSLSVKKCGYHVGKIITGDTFISSDELKYHLADEFKASCVDMESAAAAHAAYINKVPFIAVRCICDEADDKASMLFSELDSKCELLVSNFILKVIEKM